jgi:hypothetical protein
VVDDIDDVSVAVVVDVVQHYPKQNKPQVRFYGNSRAKKIPKTG